MKLNVFFITLFAALTFMVQQAEAQRAIGVAYEMRSQEPTSGIGVHYQFDLLPLPVVSLNLRFHGSYYTEEYTFKSGGAEIEVKDQSYDVGLGAILGFNVGFLAPYAGAGIGFEFFDRETIVADLIDLNEGSDSGLYYYGVVGAGFSLIPVLRPYVEYRYRGITSADFMPSEYGTWAFGVQLRF